MKSQKFSSWNQSDLVYDQLLNRDIYLVTIGGSFTGVCFLGLAFDFLGVLDLLPPPDFLPFISSKVICFIA